MNGAFERCALVDWDRSTCLCDVGLAGYVLALCVTTDGEHMAWLVDKAELANGENAACGDAHQPHEQLGPLTAAMLERVSPTPRCGRPRIDGRPCRQAVKVAGRSCAWHSERAST
ncbi:hypothetical protein A5666_27100 [Mycolicibacterium fortuitum]|nr:hypothetical protein A5665_28235 [Mycolicibacterium fortuitum]OBI68766.1 hypothetical protein A5666_27100 [Mycolicibacterium fortuitum]